MTIRIGVKSLPALLVLALVLARAGIVDAGAWPQASDPLAAAKAVADRELFGRVIADDTERPEVRVHHNWYWLDSTLMSGVAALYERTEEVGAPVPRYLDYLQAWAAHDPGGWPWPIIHGDFVGAGQTYIRLYERSGRTSDHLAKTDGMIEFIFKGRGKASQWFTPYHDYWMSFWQDDLYMIPPFLALRGRAAGSDGIPDGKDARQIAMIYCRAYDDILGDPATGLYWHDPRAKGKYFWGRGNGWVAASFFQVMKVMEQDPARVDDAAWLRGKLITMASALKMRRNKVGTWNSDLDSIGRSFQPETSGSAFFTYMLAGMINSSYLGDEYIPVVQKAWHFLRLSVTDDGHLLHVQPVGRAPTKDDFEQHSETFGVGAFLLAAVEMSKLPAAVLESADQVECFKLTYDDFNHSPNSMAGLDVAKLRVLKPDLPTENFPNSTLSFVAVIPGNHPCPMNSWGKSDKGQLIEMKLFTGCKEISESGKEIHLFYQFLEYPLPFASRPSKK